VRTLKPEIRALVEQRLRAVTDGIAAAFGATVELDFRTGYPVTGNHDADTLKREYERDVAEGAEIQLPKHYFPGDDPSRTPVNRWRSYAHLLFWNWIGEIYRSTPADVSQIGSASAPSLKHTGS